MADILATFEVNAEEIFAKGVSRFEVKVRKVEAFENDPLVATAERAMSMLPVILLAVIEVVEIAFEISSTVESPGIEGTEDIYDSVPSPCTVL